MGKLFGCCSGSKAAEAVLDGGDGHMQSRGAHTTAQVDQNSRGGGAGPTKNNRNGRVKRVTIKEDLHHAHSPVEISASDRMSVKSHGSGVSGNSVYFDADDCDDWHSTGSGSDSFDETFVALQIDGQYFFNAKDDPNISKEAFEGIHLYPPLPTTEPDPVPRTPITVNNMQTMLHTYQHSQDSAEEKKTDEDAGIALEKAGMALENQAKRLMTLDEAKSAEFMGESTNLLLKELKAPNVREKGFPGELTEEELEAVKKFREELQVRDPVYNQIVRALSAVEKEAYALCRFLRARKFDVEKVFELLDEAKEHYTKAKENEFYPDLEKALGFSRSIFLSQYPAVFSGNAKNGCPVMYLRLGMIQPEGIKCVVSLTQVDRFFWHDTTYAFTNIVKEGRRLNPNFMRTENITVYDLKGVSRSQVTADTFEMIRVGNQVMSSFPETLHCLLIINAPGWFGFVWSVVKKLIDPRTASKIEVFTNEKKGAKRMQDLIDDSQIPSDYGGTGGSLAEAAAGGSSPDSSGAASKMVVLNHLLNLGKGKQAEKSYTFELEDSRQFTLTVWTRCKAGASAALFRGEDAETKVSEVNIVGDKDDTPYQRTVGAIKGPGKFTIKLKAKSDPGVFLVLGTTSASI